jgi:acyl-CoA synthetase
MSDSSIVEEWGLRVIDPADTRAWVKAGYWNDDSLGTLLARGLDEVPNNAFSCRSLVHPWEGTFTDVSDLARRVAAGLAARGVGAGDVVSFQSPNWIEGAAVFYATCYLGAIVVPIVHFYGPKEVGYILSKSRAKVFITADKFGNSDFLANLETIRGSLPDLEFVAVFGGPAPAGDVAFADLAAHDPLTAPAVVDPTAPALIAYTSGTTSNPKGVVHTHRTIGFEIRQLGSMQSDRRPQLVGAPIGHGIGMLAALLVPLQNRQPVHLIDVWDPKRVLAAMLEDHLAAGSGATFFLMSLLDHPDLTEEHLKLMHLVGLGGSAVPAAVTERATKLGLSVVRSFGSTEHPSITGCRHEEPLAKRLYTDGRPLAGVEIRLVDEDEHDVAQGEAGEIWSRGPDCFVGYTVPELTEESFHDGWFATGDIGVLDVDGYLSITDRKKDVIIRGGENVSAQEVEEVILHMADVAEVAVVAAPDARLGEHACAIVRMRPGAAEFDRDAVQAAMRAAGLAKQKWPEELRFVDEFPRTPSGKIQKFVLRQELKGEAR